MGGRTEVQVLPTPLNKDSFVVTYLGSMDDNVESGRNLWVWLMGVVSRRRVWLVGVIYGVVRMYRCG